MANATNLHATVYQSGKQLSDFDLVSTIGNYIEAGQDGSYNYVTVLRFTLASPADGLELNAYLQEAGGKNGQCVLNYKLLNAASSSYTNATEATSGDGTWTVSGEYHAETLRINKTLAAGTWYLYLWRNKADSANGNWARFYFTSYSTFAFSISYDVLTAYTLTLTQGANSTLTVTRTSSPAGASLTTLTNGAKIYAGDVLKITYSAASGYDVSCKIGSAGVDSGYSFTVSGNVTVVTTATAVSGLGTPVLKSAAVTGTGSVQITWGAVTGAAQYAVYYKVSGGSWTRFATTTGTSCTWEAELVNGETYSFTVRCLSADGKSFTSGYDTVGLSVIYYDPAILIHIGNGTGWDDYAVYIGTGDPTNPWELYRVCIGTGNASAPWDDYA